MSQIRSTDDGTAQQVKHSEQAQFFHNLGPGQQYNNTGSGTFIHYSGTGNPAFNINAFDAESSKQSQIERQLKETFNADAHTAVIKDYEERVEDMVEDTGAWLWKEPAFLAWKSRQRSHVAVMAGPGMGKSYLAAATIRRLKACAEPDVSLAFFFVKGRDERYRHAHEILKTMAFHLQDENAEYKKHLYRVLDRQEKLWTVKQTWQALYLNYWKPFDSNRRLIIVVDGLDEASEDHQRAIGSIIRHQMTQAIQFILFGRTTLKDVLDLRGHDTNIDVTESKVRPDLENYVGRMMDDVRSVSFNEGKRQDWQNQVVSKTRGIFESARQVTINIQGMEPGRIDKFLDQPLDSVDKITAVSLERITKDTAIHADVLKTVLTWLTYSKRSLQLGEMYEILRAQDGEEHEMLLYHLRYKLRPIVECNIFSMGDSRTDTGSLQDDIEGRPPNTWTEQELLFTTVSLGHEGIRDYLKSPAASEKGYVLEELAANVEILKKSLGLFRRQRSPKLQGLTPYQLLYPISMIPTQILALENYEIPEADLFHIRTDLIWLFHDPSGNRAFLEAAAAAGQHFITCQVWFFDSRSAQAIRDLLLNASEPAMAASEILKHSGPGSALSHARLLTILRWIWVVLTALVLTLQGKVMPTESSKLVNGPSSTQKWLRVSRSSTRFFYDPLRRTAAEGWLAAPPINCKGRQATILWARMWFCIYVLVIVDSMSDSGDFDPRSTAILLQNGWKRTLDAKQFQELARRQRLEQNSEFLLNLAFPLQYTAQYGEAISLYMRVPEDDGYYPVAVMRLAQSYASMRDHNRAKEWAKKLEDCGPAMQHWCEDLNRTLLLMHGGETQALQLAKERYSANKRELNNCTQYLMILNSTGHYNESAGVFLELARMDVPGKGYNCLYQLLGDMPQAWTWACAAFGTTKGTSAGDELLAALTRCISSFSAHVRPAFLQVPHHRLFNLMLYNNGVRTAKIAIAQFEDIHRSLPDMFSGVPNAELALMHHEIVSHCDISLLYFNYLAKPDHVADEEYFDLIQKRFADIVQLATHRSSLLEAQGVHQPAVLYPVLLYGRFMRQVHLEDTRMWSSIFTGLLMRFTIVLRSTAITDVLPWVITTLNTLIHAGKDGQALTLFISLIRHRILPAPICPLCGKQEEAIDHYMCTVCLSAESCGRCSERRKLVYGESCPEHHIKTKIWPIDPDREDIVEEIDGGMYVSREWLTRLEEEWQKEHGNLSTHSSSAIQQ